jgi:hypothetical protein
MEFDPEILKRFVNFMNNPDEDTAVAQFGKGDKYFGICTLLVTMPGLPMFGHGQIEGFEEKYGMEYRRAYRDEQPDGGFVSRHEHDIFPLMKRRYLFSGSADFRLYDLYCDGGSVNENVFAYSNCGRGERALIFYNNSYYETSGWIRISDPAIPFEGGARRDSLSEALSIHGENHYFTLLREQKSNLWFIRSSKAICENGFFVVLKGYETQVYLDIYEVEDDAKGRWARLNNDLQGRGVYDPLAAIKDIFLGDLYYRFAEIFKPEFVESLCDISVKKAAVNTLNEAVKTFISTAKKFIGGAGQWDPWYVLDEKGLSRKFKPVDEKAVLQEFTAFVDRVIKLKDALKKPASPLLAGITERFTKGKLLCATVLGYSVLSLLRSIIGSDAAGSHAADLAFTHWDLGRKLREILCGFGATNDEAWRITDIIRVVLGKTKREIPVKKGGKVATKAAATKAVAAKPAAASFDAADFAAQVIADNYHDDDFRRILGINIYDDITWFNKEGFETALFYSSLFFMVEGSVDLPVEERIDRIVKIYDVLAKAEEKSEYRFDNLIENLTGKPKKTGAKVIKPEVKPEIKPKVEKKPAVKKPETKAKPSVKPAAKPVAKAKASAKPKAPAKPKPKAKPAAKPKPKEKAKKPVKSSAKPKSKKKK